MKLDQIRALIEAATPGPWEHDGEDYIFQVHNDAWQAKVAEMRGYGERLPIDANARFIAASRDLMPKLVDEVEQLRIQNARLLKVAEVAQDMWRTCPNANPEPCGRCDWCDLEKALAALETP